MAGQRDLYYAAKEVIEKCEGHHDPKEYALFRARKYNEDGDQENATVWKNIANAIEAILRTSGKGKPN